MSERLPLTIIVHTKNSATTLENCLSSLPPTEELLVVDMGSNDQSLLIARRFHARTLEVADSGYVETARAAAITAATQDWILVVDADEELPVGAGSWLAAAVAGDTKSLGGTGSEHPDIYRIPRSNEIFGKQLRYSNWWPDYQVRLFKKGSLEWPANLHAQPIISGETFDLPATEKYALIHHNYQSIEQFMNRLDRYTSIEAHSVTSRDTAPGSDPSEWFSKMINEFFNRVGQHEAWKDNAQGLAASYLQIFYPLLAELKQWQEAGFPDSANLKSSFGIMFDRVARDMAFWRADFHVKHSSGLSKMYWQIRRRCRV